MDILKFAGQVKQKLGFYLEERYQISILEMVKSNDRELTALVIRPKGEKAGAIFYMEELLGQIREGDQVDGVVAKIRDSIRNGIQNPLTEREMISVYNWEAAEKNVVFHLVNRKWNQEFLKDKPFREYLDLAVIYVLQFQRDGETLLVYIKNTQMQQWNISEEILYEAAFENTQRMLPECLLPLSEVLSSICGKDTDIPDVEADWKMPLSVLTNQKNTYGAAALLYSDNMKELAESVGDDLYILPSSVHETLLLPVGEIPVACLKELVHSVNQEVVASRERLSDEVYRYKREIGEIMICSQS
jgi:hypothetical protein